MWPEFIHLIKPFLSPLELPTLLAGHFVSPPVSTSASGHAWASVDKHCHLHYEIIVAGLSKTDDLSVNAHLHGLAEIGELDDRSTAHKRLLTGFYGSQVHNSIHKSNQCNYLHVYTNIKHYTKVVFFFFCSSGSGSFERHQC